MVPYQLTPAIDYLNLVIFVFVNVRQLQRLLSHDIYNCLISAFSSKSGIFSQYQSMILQSIKVIISGIRIFALFL